MSVTLHPTSIVHPKAVLGTGVRVGAFSIIEEGVEIGDGTEIAEHVVIRNLTRLGANCQVHSFATLGGPPQHLHYKGEPTTLDIGSGTIIRENVTCHRGTELGGGRTVIGNQVYLMAYCHIAHDCRVEDHVIMANGVQLAGHVEVGAYAGIGGLTGISQFCRVGSHSFIGACSMLRKDVPPFLIGKGNEFEVQGLNLVGLERRGFSEDAILKLKKAFKIFYLKNLTVSKAIETIITELGKEDEVGVFLDFLSRSRNGITR